MFNLQIIFFVFSSLSYTHVVKIHQIKSRYFEVLYDLEHGFYHPKVVAACEKYVSYHIVVAQQSNIFMFDSSTFFLKSICHYFSQQ